MTNIGIAAVDRDTNLPTSKALAALDARYQAAGSGTGGSGAGVDQTARDNAAHAQSTADSAQSALSTKADLQSGVVPYSQLPVIDKGTIGLTNVDNTSDANKPVSTAQSNALALKAPLASPTFTGTVGGITAAMVGLGNVNNTSDANKPVSTATASAIAAARTSAATIATLTYAATVTPNAAAAQIFRCTMTGNMTIASPTNPAEGAPIEFEFISSGGSYTPTFTTGSAGAFFIPTGLATPGAIATGTKSKYGFRYSTVTQRWEFMYQTDGYSAS